MPYRVQGPSFLCLIKIRMPFGILIPMVRLMGLEPIRLPTRPSNVRVCQFRHSRISAITKVVDNVATCFIIHNEIHLSIAFLIFFIFFCLSIKHSFNAGVFELSARQTSTARFNICLNFQSVKLNHELISFIKKHNR